MTTPEELKRAHDSKKSAVATHSFGTSQRDTKVKSKGGGGGFCVVLGLVVIGFVCGGFVVKGG